MPPTIIPDNKKTHIPKWHVMLHPNIGNLERCLKETNVDRLQKGLPLIESFFPYSFIRERAEKEKPINGALPSEEVRDLAFIYASAETIKQLKSVGKGYAVYTYLRYYRNQKGESITVPDKMMRIFFNDCVNKRNRYEVWPSISGLKKKDKVRIMTGAFVGNEAYVVDISHSKGKLNLFLAIPLANGLVNICMRNVTRRQITIPDKDNTDALRDDFIDFTQNNLLEILSRRIKGNINEETARKDVAMLNRLYRYRNYNIEGNVARRHFLALMIICAHLRYDYNTRNALAAQALEEIEAINSQGEARAATDTRAYLLIALYIATRKAEYRDLVKKYVREHDPKSPKLRRFVSIIRKRNNF